MSWRWVSHKTRVGESLVWIASIWSLANHFLSLSLFSFSQPLHHWIVTCGRQKCLSVSLQHKAHRDLEAHPKGNMEKSIVLLTGLCAAILPHACSMLGEILWKNHRTICRTGHYSESVNVTEFLQLFTFHQHLRAYKKQKVLWQAPPGWMHTRRGHMLHTRKNQTCFAPMVAIRIHSFPAPLLSLHKMECIDTR